MNRFGKIVHRAWMDLPRHYPYVTLDAFMVMPNHVHTIVILRTDEEGRGGSPPVGKSMAIKSISDKFIMPDGAQTRPYYRIVRHGLPEIVRAFKSFSSRRINQIRRTPGVAVWQRNYYEHIVRNQPELERIRQYIARNPSQWAADEENREG